MGVKLNFLRAGRVSSELISDIVTSDLTFLCTCMCAQDSLRHPSYSWQNAKWAQNGKKKIAMDIFCTSVVTKRFKKNQYFSKKKSI